MACDDGDPATVADACDGQGACAGIAAACGDNVTEGLETCDDGNQITESCQYGEVSCTVCDANCQEATGELVGYCGDGEVQADKGEECDDGDLADGANGCNPDCSIACSVSSTGSVNWTTKVLPTSGGMYDSSGLRFGFGVEGIGDVNGDGVPDLAVGSPLSSASGLNEGSLALAFLEEDGTVVGFQKIEEGSPGFTGELDEDSRFGWSIANVGDIDGNGVPDLAVGSPGYGLGAGKKGAIWILFMNPNGTVVGHKRIGDGQGGFTGLLNTGGEFGNAIAPMGDLNADGVPDVAVGAYLDDTVYILYLKPDGEVLNHLKIANGFAGFTGAVSSSFWGADLARLPDINGDGLDELVVGAHYADYGGLDRGAVWILFLNSDESVSSWTRISDLDGDFTGVLDNSDHFGVAVESAGDLDGDAVADLIVGARGDDDGEGGIERGAVWILFLNQDGTVKGHSKISETSGGFPGGLDLGGNLGHGVASIGDLDGDGTPEIGAGAPLDDADAFIGSVWVLSLDSVCTTCGDNIKEGPETCDDGNLVSGDGCSALCDTELDCTSLGGGGSGACVGVTNPLFNDQFTSPITMEMWLLWPSGGVPAGLSWTLFNQNGDGAGNSLQVAVRGSDGGLCPAQDLVMKFKAVDGPAGTSPWCDFDQQDKCLCGTKQFDEGVWNHLAVVIEETGTTAWINGEHAGSGPIGLAPNTGTFSAGCENAPSPSYVFTSLLGAVRVTTGTRYLTPFEPALALLPEDETLLLWDFAAGTADDVSGNGFHGWTNNVSYTSDGPGCL